MAALPTLSPQAHRILQLSRTDRAAARAAMATLGIEEQTALVCEAPVARRSELIDLSPEPERLIPALPPAELCFTAKAVGLPDAGWLMEHATAEQITACLDLDAWQDFTPDRSRLDEWLEAFADASDEALLRSARAMDMELLVLHMKSRISVVVKPSDEGWVPPAQGRTLDGQFYFCALREKDDLEDVDALLRTLFQNDYWVYFRLLQGVIWELIPETEEWALRWRTGRLQDLGFPTWEESMRIYGFIRPEARSELPEGEHCQEVGEWPLPIWMPNLPVQAHAEQSIFRAMAELSEEERRPHLHAFLALVNRIAVADRMPLGDAETIPRAIERAAETASAGLDHLSRENAVDPVDVLRRVTVERLFRVGHNLTARSGQPPGVGGAQGKGPRE
jgi:hypothetical protein